MSDLPQSRTIYRRGMKYKATVAMARIKQASRERKGTVQLNMLWRNHVRVSLSEPENCHTVITSSVVLI